MEYLLYICRVFQADLFIVQPVKIELINEGDPNQLPDCFPFNSSIQFFVNPAAYFFATALASHTCTAVLYSTF